MSIRKNKYFLRISTEYPFRKVSIFSGSMDCLFRKVSISPDLYQLSVKEIKHKNWYLMIDRISTKCLFRKVGIFSESTDCSGK